jgi:hypothetical protein
MNRHAWTFAAATVAFCGAALAAPHAHQHGALALAVAVDGAQLSVQLQAPLESLLGFERAPRTDAERRAAAELLARLRGGDAAGLFKADAAAQCTLSSAEVQAGVLEPAGKTAGKDDAKDDTKEDGHADLEAVYTFTCAQPGQLRTLEVGLFEAFKRVRRIDVQVAGPKGQRKQWLERPNRTIDLQK